MSELSWVSWLVPISVFFAWWYLNIRWLKTIVGFLFSIIFNYCCGSNMQYDHMHLYIIHISCNITCFARSDTASDLFFSSVPVKPCTAVELRMFYYVQLSCLECYNSSWDGFFFFLLSNSSHTRLPFLYGLQWLKLSNWHCIYAKRIKCN